MTKKQTIRKCFKLVQEHFKDEPEKSFYWFTTKNPMLGQVEPITFIEKGNHTKLLKLIESLLDGNHP